MSEQGYVPCALVLGENHILYSVCRPLGGLPATSTILRFGVERRRQALCGGRGDPLPWWRSSLVEPGAKVTVIVFTEETWWPRSNTFCECFNNVDVGVPLWLTEPWNKSSYREFASSHLLFTFSHFILQLVCLYFHRIS